MKVNKTILFGVFFILLASVIFISNNLNPFIRPITHLFLMGSSKGKDIIFFGLFGLFLIFSQIINVNLDNNKYLKTSIVIGSLLLLLGIVLEIFFRLQMGIALNTVFVTMIKSVSSTSIMHTHLLKSIIGEVLMQIIGSYIPSDINTAIGLYNYIPKFSFMIILLIPLLFTTIIIASQKRTYIVNIFLAFFSSCLLIGSIDGGLFSKPAIFGIFGLYFVYRNEYYINYAIGTLLKDETLLNYNKTHPSIYQHHRSNKKRFIFNRVLIYLILIVFIFLRLTMPLTCAETEYYTVEIENTTGDIDFGDIPITQINNTTYHVNSNYNELDLINDLKKPLNNSCNYYTVSWNGYSYY